MDTIADRRNELRTPPVLRGPGVIIAAGARIPVTIVNVSVSGIMLSVPDEAVLSGPVALEIGAVARPCDLIWQSGSRIGLRFSA